MNIRILYIFWGLIILFSAIGSHADPLNQWTWRFPYPQGWTLTAVAYGGGKFVAVGANGTIITSPDGFNWTVQTQGVFPILRGVAYAGGEYAVVGDGGIILVSSNATTWTQISSVTINSLHGIAGDPTWRADGVPQFMAVGDYGTAVQCLNGTNWSVIFSDTTNALFSVTYLDTDYIAVGNAGTVTTYDSLKFIRNPQASIGTINNFYTIASDGNSVVGLAGDLTINPFASTAYLTNQILYSLDYGYDWNHQQWLVDYRDGISQDLWYLSELFILTGMTFGPNGFVSVGYTGYGLEYHPAVVMTSADGTFWSELPYSTSENPLSGVTYGNGLYVAVGDYGSIVVSSNAVNWTEISPDRRSQILAIACNTNLCIATALNASYSWGFPDFSILISTNGGINWDVSKKRGELPAITDLDSGMGRFVGVSGTSIFTTTDGYIWQNNNSFTNSFNGIRYLNNHFFAVGNNGSIYSSTNGINWNDHSLITNGSLNSVAYGNGFYVTAGSIAATSSDGINWSICPSNPPAIITKIIFGKGLFVGTTYSDNSYFPSGSIVTSKDGINWQIPLTSAAFSGIAYSGGIFLASSGAFGATYKSTDGTNWQQTSSSMPLGLYQYYQFLNPFPSSYSTVCSYKGNFFVGGMDGMLIQSGNIWSPALINTPQVASNRFSFLYTQQIDVPYHIQASTNLLNWESIYGGIGTGESTNFIYSTSGNYTAKFFRITSP